MDKNKRTGEIIMQKDRSKIREDLEGFAIRSFTHNAIGSIVRTEAKIHRLSFSEKRSSGISYNYDYFKECLGVGINHDFKPLARMPKYKKQLFRQYQGFTLSVFIDPTMGFYPPFRMEITPNDKINSNELKEILSCLCELYPKLTVSSAEYAIDLYCREAKEVENLFQTIRRGLYIPYQKSAVLRGESLGELGNNTRTNFVFYIEDVKVYERGDDTLKNGHCYPFCNLNKVRLEFRASLKVLKNYGIQNLTDFIRCPKFFDINGGRYKFKMFRGLKLPQFLCWNSYAASDSDGNVGAFQSEYLDKKAKYKNSRQFMVDIPEFENLASKINDSMLRFDSEWVAGIL